MRVFIRNILGHSNILAVSLASLALFFSACGEGGSQNSSSILLNSSLVVGQWTLQSYQGEKIADVEAAQLMIETPSSIPANPDCSGSVKAVMLSDSQLELTLSGGSGCFVDFAREVQINRSRITDVLKAGSNFQLNSDSTLTLQNQTATLVFAPVH